MGKWYHPSCSGQDAIDLLQGSQPHSFLVRPSFSSPGNFVLSINLPTGITHIRVQNSGDCFDLFGGDTFASLQELVEFYLQNPGQLREASGTEIVIKHPIHCQDPLAQRWYYGDLSTAAAKALLTGNDTDHGSFLVRASQKSPGDYILSVRVEEKVAHIMMRCVRGQYTLTQEDMFDSPEALIEHYKIHPLENRTGNSVITIDLKCAVNGSRIPMSTFKDRVEMLKVRDPKKGKNGFMEEYDKLQQFDASCNKTRVEGKRPENKKKNRYKNILPYDETRVVLRHPEKGVGGDYVNANYITFPNNEKFIASQGPLPATVNEFWQMIYENEVSVISMTTNCVERGRNKCYKYWPDVKDDVRKFNGISVTCVSDVVYAEYTLREFTLKHSKDKKSWQIYQFHYTTWPDHGVPKKTRPIINYLNDMEEARARATVKGPMLIHCSAGIGRTGTVMAIQRIMKMDKSAEDASIDIVELISSMRAQRSGMVQTLEQYAFIYVAVLEHFGLLPAQPDA